MKSLTIAVLYGGKSTEHEVSIHSAGDVCKELQKNHNKMPHGGMVIRSGETSDGNKHIIEYKLTLDSNPEFTSSILVAYARASYKLNNEGASGCKTVFDIAPAYLTSKSNEEIRATML